MRKLVFAIDTNTAGGAERVISVLVNYFANHNYEVLLVNADSDSAFYAIDPKVTVLKMRLATDKKGKIAQLKRLFQKYRFIHSLLKKENPDAIITFLFNMELPAILAGLATHTPTFSSVRNSVKAFSRIELFIMRLLYVHINGVVFQSNDVMNNPVFKKVKTKCVIMNPLSDNLIGVKPIDFSHRNEKIINVGRLQEQKNQALLIEAFEKVASDYPNVELHIYGTGPLKDELQKRIEMSDYSKRMVLEGVKEDAILNNKDARLFVLCSNYEGFPNVLVEAMAAGIPVVSSNFDSGVAAEWIEQGENGELFDVGNMESLANAIRKMMDAREMTDKMVAKSQELVKAIYPERIGEQWEMFIDQHVLL